MMAFFVALWPQASPALGDQPGIRDDGSIRGGGAGEIDPIENLSRFHYMKELYLDSATTMTVLSCTPTSPDTNNPLPLAEAALTVNTANDMAEVAAGDHARLRHAEPRQRGHDAGPADRPRRPAQEPPTPLFFDEEMEQMWTRAEQYHDILGGWKTYCAWGDVPVRVGLAAGLRLRAWRSSRTSRRSATKYPDIPPVVATHKGFALPGLRPARRCAARRRARPPRRTRTCAS